MVATRPFSFLIESERTAAGEIIPGAVLFLTNSECPWTCLMCDLWKNTLTQPLKAGEILRQIDHALDQLPPSRQIKLYNSGSFFDSRAVPLEDYVAIAERLAGFERVIVECHPALINDRVQQFRDLISGQLEVAMGLETAHPEALEQLNKRMTLDDYAEAAAFLKRGGIALRSFVLVQPPFVPPNESVAWAKRSAEFAFQCGATVVSLIPTRLGNGALDALAEANIFAPPTLATIEQSFDAALGLGGGRVFSDLWDLEVFSTCPVCFEERRGRLERMNFEQVILLPVCCSCRQ